MSGLFYKTLLKDLSTALEMQSLTFDAQGMCDLIVDDTYPLLTRQPGGRLNLQQINLEQGQSNSAASSIAIRDGETPDGKKTFASLLAWAKKAQKLRLTPA